MGRGREGEGHFGKWKVSLRRVYHGFGVYNIYDWEGRSVKGKGTEGKVVGLVSYVVKRKIDSDSEPPLSLWLSLVTCEWVRMEEHSLPSVSHLSATPFPLHSVPWYPLKAYPPPPPFPNCPCFNCPSSFRYQKIPPIHNFVTCTHPFAQLCPMNPYHTPFGMQSVCMTNKLAIISYY